MTNNLTKKIATAAMLAVSMGALLGGGAAVLKAQVARRVPCTHIVAAHPYDVVYDGWGNAIGTQPCVHLRTLHSYDVVFY
jgi:hypothetical protein